jgi:hypothetical protein
MLRTVTLLFFTICTVFTLQAEVRVLTGARAGLTIAHLRKFSAPDTYKKSVNLGSDLAAVLRIDFNKNFGIQTEVEFIQKGQSYRKTADSAKFVSKTVMNYIQFPLLFVARVGSKKNEKVKAVFFLGPYFSYWAGGYNQSAVSVDKQTRTATTNTYKFTNKDMRFDVGLITGIGTNIKVGKGWIEIAARHNLGWMNISKKDAGLPKLYNCNFNLSFGYLYTIK